MTRRASTPDYKPLINLLRGWPSPSLLPFASLNSASQKILSNPSLYNPVLQYGPDQGYPPLRSEVAKYLFSLYGANAKYACAGADPERVCITGGASQNMTCILQSFTDPLYTRGVWMIAPCYFLACPIFEDSGYGGRLRAFPEDDEGANLGMLEAGMEKMEREWRQGRSASAGPAKNPKARKIYKFVIYVVATCANPSGKSMSLRRREELVKLARKYDALIISDDVYDFLQWDSSGEWKTPEKQRQEKMRLPRLTDVDRELDGMSEDGFGNAVSNGSFSKMVGPGMRTGWVDATPNFAFGLAQTGSTKSGGAPSQFCAAMIAEMLKNGDLQEYVDKVCRPALQKRHKLMVETIEREILPIVDADERAGLMRSIRGDGSYGGYFVWLSLGEAWNAARVAYRALKEENLILGEGGQFEVKGDEKSLRFKREIRLCFSWENEESVVEGVSRLGAVMRRMIDQGEVGKEPTDGLDSRLELEDGTY